MPKKSHDRKLIIIQAVAPDYRKFFFETLKKKLGDRFELYAGEQGFEKSIKTDSKIHKKLKNHYLFKRRFVFQTGIWHLLLRDDIIVMELNPRNFSTWIFLIIRKLFRKPTVLWGHAWPRKGKEAKSDVIRHLMRKSAGKIIVYTKQQQRELQKKMPHKTVLSAPNAIYPRNLMGLPDNDRPEHLIYVGRLVESKKPFFLVKAFRQALDILPSNVKLFLAGDGDEYAKIRDFIRRHRLENRVELLGHVNDYGRLRDLYGRSLFSVSPGYIGLSVTQSFGFGVPMLISKHENHSPEIEAAIEGENALFFETGNTEDFIEKLKSIYANIDYWKHRRPKIVEFCRNNYSTETMAQTFINLLRYD